MNTRKIAIRFRNALLLCIGCMALFGCQGFRGGVLVINEAVADNRSSYLDERLGAADWIELYNAGNGDVRLSDYVLTDNMERIGTANILPDIVIPAGEYRVLTAAGETGDGTPSLPFKLGKGGETLYLLNSAGHLVQKLILPALGEDISFARRADGSFGYCLTPTPNGENTTEIVTALADETVPSERSDLQVFLSEIVSNPVPTDARGDWVELFNPTDADIDLNGCHLTDDKNDPRKLTIRDTVLPAHGYVVVPCGRAADIPGGSVPLGIASEGETVWLFDAHARSIDSADVPALGRGTSYARRADGSFGYCGVPTPGDENDSASIREEPFYAMEASAPVRINEALFDNAYSCINAYGDRTDWVELYNAGDAPVPLLGYYLSDRADDPARWAFPDVTLDAGAHLVVQLSGKPSTDAELHADFSVSDEEAGVYLYHAATLSYDFIACSQDTPENVSVGRGVDGETVYYAYPTPGYANAEAFSDLDALTAFPINDVFISEVSAGGSAGEWIELCNGRDTAADLTGWTLSGDAIVSEQYRLDGVTVRAGGYIALDAAVLPFGVSFSGETLLLSDADGVCRDVFHTGALTDGQTAGRVADEPRIARAFFSRPTRGKANDVAYGIGRAGAPFFSDTALYRDAPFSLTIDADPLSTVRYTLDGSVPTARSSAYTEPIAIVQSTTVRAVAFRDGMCASEPTTAHFLFSEPHTLPVVCIAMEPAHWKLLLKVPFLEQGMEERAAQLTFYHADGAFATAFPAGVRPRGNASIAYPQKSLSVHLRGRYGQSAVTYPFWGGSGGIYASLVLRNGSQDIGMARLRDSFANRAVEGMHLDHTATRPVIVYVNGAYYGIMDLNEGMNQDWLETHYGVDPNAVDIVARNDAVKHGSADDFVRVRTMARTGNFSDDAALATLSEQVDIPYITDYLIAQTFFGNYDIHNQNYWRAPGSGIRWRPYLYDVDRCLGERSVNINMFAMYFSTEGVVHTRAGHRVYMEINCALRENAAWRAYFVERYIELLNTSLSEARLTALLDEMAASLRPEMARHIARWEQPRSVEAWEDAVEALRVNIGRRHAVIKEQIMQTFGVDEAEWQRIAEKY